MALVRRLLARAVPVRRDPCDRDDPVADVTGLGGGGAGRAAAAFLAGADFLAGAAFLAGAGALAPQVSQ
jgi:hypothetical protein